jgi:cytochrome c peroxidase
MKKKEILDDLEIYLDPKPLTKEEELGLSLFIRKIKNKSSAHNAKQTKFAAQGCSNLGLDTNQKFQLVGKTLDQ